MSETDNERSGDDKTLNMVARAQAVNNLCRLRAERLRGAMNRNLGGRFHGGR